MFKVGIGVSKNRDPFLAGEEAGRQCLIELEQETPDICFLFSSVKFAHLRTLTGIKAVLPDVPLFGVSDAGEITSEGSLQRSLVLVGIKSDRLAFSAHLEEDIGIEAREKGRRIAERVKKGLQVKDRNKEILVLFSDGLSGSIADIIRGAQEVLGTSYPILGGGAGDDFLFRKTYQYYQDRVFEQSAFGLILSLPKIGFGMRHGWKPLGRPYKVTRAKKNVVQELDHKPAIEVYQNYFGREIEELEKSVLVNMIINYPLGIAVPGEKEYLVRNVLDIHLDGSLVFSADINEGEEVRLMMSNKEMVVAAARDASWEAIRGVWLEEIGLGIVFNSASRCKLLGRGRDKEIEEIRGILRQIPFVGFYGYSQQAPLSGGSHLGQCYAHNQSVVVLVLGE
ncbi:MAG: hypothetical protein DRP75_01025 [Candidatus Omnitrophota bacterium]|nr:MAG: hypothetical protein DRP75_01025 [Candidatus Omnitrophota bacterium]